MHLFDEGERVGVSFSRFGFSPSGNEAVHPWSKLAEQRRSAAEVFSSASADRPFSILYSNFQPALAV